MTLDVDWDVKPQHNNNNSFSMKCIGYNTNYTGAVTQSNLMDNTYPIVTNTLCRENLTKP